MTHEGSAGGVVQPPQKQARKGGQQEKKKALLQRPLPGSRVKKQTSWLSPCPLLAQHHMASEMSSNMQAGAAAWGPGREGEQNPKQGPQQERPGGLLRISGFSLSSPKRGWGWKLIEPAGRSPHWQCGERPSGSKST